jgi:hypothetical protein
MDDGHTALQSREHEGITRKAIVTEASLPFTKAVGLWIAICMRADIGVSSTKWEVLVRLACPIHVLPKEREDRGMIGTSVRRKGARWTRVDKGGETRLRV